MMKKTNLLTILFLLLGTTILKAQPILEHTYQNNTLNYILLSEGGKYYIADGLKFTFYNLDHSLYKEVDLTNYLSGYAITADYHISDRLINSDPSLDFFLVLENATTPGSGPRKYVYVNENGVEVFDFDLLKNPTAVYHGFNVEFVKTATSTYKMIVKYSDDQTTKWTKVYSLPGTLPEITSTISPYGLLDLKTFPNPASTYTRVAYELPSDCEQGLIRIFDTKGKLISEFGIGNDFNEVLINTSEFQERNVCIPALGK